MINCFFRVHEFPSTGSHSWYCILVMVRWCPQIREWHHFLFFTWMFVVFNVNVIYPSVLYQKPVSFLEIMQWTISPSTSTKKGATWFWNHRVCLDVRHVTLSHKTLYHMVSNGRIAVDLTLYVSPCEPLCSRLPLVDFSLSSNTSFSSLGTIKDL